MAVIVICRKNVPVGQTILPGTGILAVGRVQSGN